MFKRIYILLLLMASTMYGYGLGDQVSEFDQNISFDVCSGEYPSNQLSLADFNGATNGGNYHILFIDISASW